MNYYQRQKHNNLKTICAILLIACVILVVNTTLMTYKFFEATRKADELTDMINTQEYIIRQQTKTIQNTRLELDKAKQDLEKSKKENTDLQGLLDKLSLKKTEYGKIDLAAAKEFKVTAYDLSVASCGKSITSRGYGQTRSGYNLSSRTREGAMTIAVDPRVIPLGSRVLVVFKDKKYQRYNGVYTARDTGGAVKGNHIDLFMGDFKNNKESKVVNDFGVTKASVQIIKKS
jgi:3D (Asp-Asp-Asp) domain-containing protein